MVFGARGLGAAAVDVPEDERVVHEDVEFAVVVEIDEPGVLDVVGNGVAEDLGVAREEGGGGPAGPYPTPVRAGPPIGAAKLSML